MSRRTRRRRAEASYGPEVGTTYLLHFIDPATGQAARYQHAGHYIGWTQDLPARLEAHASGAGARLVEVITQAGLGFTLARIWPETTRDREDLLKHCGDARRFCPECGVKPRLPAPATGPARPTAVRRAEAPLKVAAYDFADWPDLTLRHTASEAAELTACLARGRQKAYKAATATGGRTGPGREYLSLFDTAIEVDFAWQKAVRETVQFHGREPDEPVDEWIDRIRQEAPHQPQEDDMFRRKAAYARQQAEADQRQQAEADRLFALADELDRQAGERPDYRREITRERAARIMRQLGEPLPPDIALTGPDIAGLHPDPHAAQRPGPEFRDSAGTMDPDRAAQALGRRREDVQAAVREQAVREAQLGDWSRGEAARPAAPGSAELAGADLDAEIDRLARAYPEPADHTAPGWDSTPVDDAAAPGDEPGTDAPRWAPGRERDGTEMAGELLSRHAAEAEDALRRERQATAYERFAQRVRDPELLGLARQVASNARRDRQAATADAYAAAASLHQSAFGPGPEDAGSYRQHAPDNIAWSPDVTSRPEHQLEAG